ncbi:hypothetical protein CAPTEDRAFT_186122, partial [Capitella teleta]
YSSTDPCNRPSFCISGDDPEIVADPDDCKKFFQCLFNQWAHLTCSGASTFDSKSKRCVSKDATCFPACPVFTGYYTESATGMPPGTPENCTEGEIYPDASSCQSYYFCNNGDLQLKFCDVFTPVFDIHKLECTLRSTDFDCQYRCKTAGPSTQFPTTTGTAQLHTTELTTQTDKHTEQQITKLTTLQSTSLQPETTDQTVRHTEQQTNEPTTSSTSQPSTSSTLDPCNRDWFCDNGDILPDPDSCLHYFYCTDGQWGRIRCPRGYLFDWSSAYCRDEEVICHPKCPPKPTPVEPGLCETVTSCVHQLIAFRAKNTLPGCKRKEIMHSEYRGYHCACGRMASIAKYRRQTSADGLVWLMADWFRSPREAIDFSQSEQSIFAIKGHLCCLRNESACMVHSG